MRVYKLVFEIPKVLDYHDAFKMMEDTPTNIKIVKFEPYINGEISERDNVYSFEFMLTDTNQTVYYSFVFPGCNGCPDDTYYVGLDYELYPLFSFASGIKNNAIMVRKDEIQELVGLEFKATVKTKKLKVKPFSRIKRDLKCVILPVTGGQTTL